MVPILSLIPDPAERGEWTRLLAITTNAQRADIDESIRMQRRAAAMGRDSADEPVVPPRKLTPAERHFCDALRILVDHPTCARLIPGEQLASLTSDEALGAVARAVHRVALAGRSANELVDALEGEARSRFLALVSEARPDLEDEAKAERIFRDELAWLAREQQRERSRALTQSVILGSAPTEDLITLKQRELEERRAARGLPPG
jgi:hypothetical protein